MTKTTAVAGFVTLLFLAACAKQEAPPAAAAPADDPEQEQAIAAPATPEPPHDYAKMANGMMSLLADTPECQRFHDELHAIAQTPLGAEPARDPALVVAEAHSQKCSKKSQQQ